MQELQAHVPKNDEIMAHTHRAKMAEDSRQIGAKCILLITENLRVHLV